MNHRPITEDDLHAYVDRVLEPERQAEVAAYLEGHPDMARRVAAFWDQRDLLREALPGFASGHLRPYPISSDAIYSLADAKEAYLAVIGSSRDRIIFKPSA